MGRVYTIVANKYYIDEMVNASVVRGTTALSRILTWIDENIVDGLVLLMGRIHKALGFACAWVDKHIVDGRVNLVASLTQVCGSVGRLVQTGRIQQYVSFAAAGGTLLAAFHILS